MSKKTFNPAEWLSKPNAEQITFDSAEAQPTFAARQWATNKVTETNATAIPTIPQSNIDTSNEIETITQRIEAASVDIAPNYADWRDLGFALADALGENGRNYYHRLSRFYPSYSQSETDKQYSACLASHGHGVTIKTLYHLTKSAGVSVSIPQPSKQKSSILQNGDLKDLGEEDFSPHGGDRGGCPSYFSR